MKIHPNDERLEQFALSLGGGHQDLLRHLAACIRCRARLHLLSSPEPRSAARPVQPRTESEYGVALERSLQNVLRRAMTLDREREEAQALFVELMEQPPEQREVLLCNGRRFLTWGLFELLVNRSWEVCIRDPGATEELGFLALRLSSLLDTSRYGAELIQDFRARIWGYISNARRLRSDLHGAEEAFVRAFDHLQRGTGDPNEQALLLDLKSSLLRDERRFPEALKLLQRAAFIFSKNGEQHRAGRSMFKLSVVHNQSGHPERAVPMLLAALDLIDAGQEPRLLLSARHNLTVYLVDLGRCEEARSEYHNTHSLYRLFTDAWTKNRRQWVKGRIAYGLGQLAQAESLLLAARDGFLAEGVPYDTALVALELAVLYARQGRTAELKRVAEELVPVFASRQIHREALAALAFFRQAVAAERASLELVVRVASFLKQAQHDPGLRFQQA
ncbi:MAG TPA: hypothetical protein VMW27_29790 [Thermoanaerobaculia bacterium]|nr:hypothetical protein [Thermoanaerobaculia bacterium]